MIPPKIVPIDKSGSDIRKNAPRNEPNGPNKFLRNVARGFFSALVMAVAG